MSYYIVHYDVVGSFDIELEAESEAEARRLAEIEAKEEHGHLIDKQVIDRFEVIDIEEISEDTFMDIAFNNMVDYMLDDEEFEEVKS